MCIYLFKYMQYIYIHTYIYIYRHMNKIYRTYNGPLDESWWVSERVRPDCGSAQRPGASVPRAMVGVETLTEP